MGLLDSMFKKKGVTRKKSKENDFAIVKATEGQKLGPLTKRDKIMIAKGRCDIHTQNYNDYKYNDNLKKNNN